MKRKFFVNLLFLLSLNLLIKPFWVFGIDRTVQNINGAGDYGMFFALFNLSVILNIYLDIGITNFNNRAISQNPSILGESLKNISGLKIVLSLVYAAICILSGLMLGYDQEKFHLLYILIINQVLASFVLYFRSNISGLQLFISDSILSVLDRFLMILICSVWIWGGVSQVRLTVQAFALAQTVAYCTSGIVALLILAGRTGRFIPRFRYRFSMDILRQSYPFAILVLLMSFYNRIDAVMLEKMLGEEGRVQAGIYAQAFRLLDAFSMVGFSFGALLLPMFSRMLAKKQDVLHLLRFAFLLIIVPTLILAFASLQYAPHIMSLLYHEHTGSSSGLLGILMIGMIGISTSYIFGTLLTANGNLRQLNLLAFSVLVLNVTLNLVMIPRWKAQGAAIASLCTQLFAGACQVIIAGRIFRFGKNPKLLLNLLLYAAILFLLGALTGRLIHAWIPAFFLFCSLSLLVAIYLKLFSFRELILLVQGKE